MSASGGPDHDLMIQLTLDPIGRCAPRLYWSGHFKRGSCVVSELTPVHRKPTLVPGNRTSTTFSIYSIFLWAFFSVTRVVCGCQATGLLRNGRVRYRNGRALAPRQSPAGFGLYGIQSAQHTQLLILIHASSPSLSSSHPKFPCRRRLLLASLPRTQTELGARVAVISERPTGTSRTTAA